MGLGAGRVLNGAFQARQRADIDQPVIGSGGDRRGRDQREREGQQPFPCRDLRPQRDAKHVVNLRYLPAPDSDRAGTMAATLIAHEI